MEKIYTIPVNEAYESECECPLCRLRAKAEDDYLEYYLGPSLMEPDTRKITNKTGFCPDHMGKLNRKEVARLGLGLMLHTHLKDYYEDLSGDIKAAAPGKASLLKGRTSDYKAKLNSIADRIDKRTVQCPICERIDYTMDRYMEVIVYLFAHDKDFHTKFENKKAHCLPHTAMLLRMAASKMSQNDASDFVLMLASNNEAAFEELIKDVEWFTLKFDYRNNDKPWGNSKNAIQRAMRFLSSDRSDFDEKGRKNN